MEKLLNGTQLAEAIPCCVTKVQAMKKMGFKFSHGRLTTRSAALKWLAANPEFKMTQAYPKRSLAKKEQSLVLN